MSILIKGMEMPKDIEPGLVIEFADGIDGKRYARLYHYQHGGLTEWLEAISIPPHGRLIDGDALYEKFLRLESESMSALQTTSVGSIDGIKWSAILTERTDYKFDIVDAPTVIPAEEGQ